MKAIIVGVPGTGKTSVAEGLEKHGWRLVSFGTVMFEVAKDRYGLKHRDEMRTKIPAEEYKLVQAEAAARIGAMEGDIVIDTHCSVKKPEGYYPGLPIMVLEKIRPDAFVLVEAKPADIRKRREKDADIRKRPEDPEEHQNVNRYYAAVYSVMSGAPMAFVENKQGKLKETQELVAELLSKVRKNG